MVSRPLVAVSLKTYLGQGQTLEWVKSAVEASRPWLDAVDVLVAPIATALVETVKAVAGGGVLVGAQDCSWTSPGPYTGELPAAVLREIGVSVVELGHAERRSLFGEDDLMIALKVAAAAREGLVPMVCVGETQLQSPQAAAKTCLAQVDAALAEVPPTQPVVIAYEPIWAIGADAPASPGHIRTVCHAIQEHLHLRGQGSRVIYGGTAGPGLFASVYPDVDGLFLGRRAHDVASFAAVLQEVSDLTRQHRVDRTQELELT